MLARVEVTLTVLRCPSAYLGVLCQRGNAGAEEERMYSFCASMITSVELSTVALEGPTPTSSRKDFAPDIFEIGRLV